MGYDARLSKETPADCWAGRRENGNNKVALWEGRTRRVKSLKGTSKNLCRGMYGRRILPSC